MASTYLSRTPSSAGNRRTFTVSVWLKKTLNNAERGVFSAWNADSTAGHFNITFQSDNHLKVGRWSSDIQTTRKFTDVNGWYHLVVAVDTTQATAADRVKSYINGEQILSANNGYSAENYPSQNDDIIVNNTVAHNIGRNLYSSPSGLWAGDMAHFHFTDGTAYAASTFGETDSTSGIWVPKTNPSVTYGTNGFFLKFENSANMGLDSSGNSNNWTVGAGTLTQNIDSPTNVYNTLTFLGGRRGTIGNGGLSHEGSGATAPDNAFSNFAVQSGKWYAEAKIITGNNYNGIGVISEKNPYMNKGTDYLSNSNDALMYVYSDIYRGGSTISGTYAQLAVNDIVQIALDADNNFLYFGVNGTWQNSSDPTSGSSGTGALNLATYLGTGVDYFIAGEQGGASNTRKIELNFGGGYFGTTAVASANADANGHGIFEYAVPSGYYAMNTKNIKEFG